MACAPCAAATRITSAPLWFLICATAFDDTITSEAELVEALHYGTYRPMQLPRMDTVNAEG